MIKVKIESELNKRFIFSLLSEYRKIENIFFRIIKKTALSCATKLSEQARICVLRNLASVLLTEKGFFFIMNEIFIFCKVEILLTCGHRWDHSFDPLISMGLFKNAPHDMINFVLFSFFSILTIYGRSIFTFFFSPFLLIDNYFFHAGFLYRF